MFKVSCLRSNEGFTFIELLIVISLMAIVAASVSAAFLNFEKRQRVMEAALIVKNGIRTMQNSATSGKDVNCTLGYLLAGWYFKADLVSGTLVYGVYCFNPNAPYDISNANFVSSEKFLKLPQGVALIDVKYGPLGNGTSITPLYIFYRTLKSNYSFHNNLPFVDIPSGDLTNFVGTMPQDPVTIILSGSGVTYGVVVMPSGEVYETKS